MYLMVEVSGINGIRIDTKGDQRKKMLMLGGLEVARRIIEDQIMEEVSITRKTSPDENDTLQPQKTNHNDGNKQVPKKQAVDFYLELRNTIDKRLTVIANADDRTNFIIPAKIDL